MQLKSISILINNAIEDMISHGCNYFNIAYNYYYDKIGEQQQLLSEEMRRSEIFMNFHTNRA